MHPEIPGYYYDAEKRRYFKVEASRTAPAQAAWSSDKVKRRKIADDESAEARRRAELGKGRIRRAAVLSDPLTGGFFAREVGAMPDDMQAACFARGLRDQGCVSLHTDFTLITDEAAQWRAPGPQVRHMYVDGQDTRTGMCAVFATSDEESLVSGYIPRNKHGRLDQRLVASHHTTGIPPYNEFMVNQLNDIKYHAPSSQVLLASCHTGFNSRDSILWAFSPTVTEKSSGDGRREPHWRLPSDFFASVPLPREDKHGCTAHCIAPAAASSSSLICAVGADRGILTWSHSGDDRLTWLTPPDLYKRRTVTPGSEDLTCQNVFAIDFQPTGGNGSGSVIRFGGRAGFLSTADIRTPLSEWSHTRLPSSVAHLRCLRGGDQVLVACLENHLGVYDTRFVRSTRRAESGSARLSYDGHSVPNRATRNSALSSSPSNRPNLEKHGGRSYNNTWNQNRRPNGDVRGSRGGGSNGNNLNDTRHDDRNRTRRDQNTRTITNGQSPIAQPVIVFDKYRNAARTDLGFAYDESTGLVAAAHDEDISDRDGEATVGLYSIRTGAQLRALDGFAGPVVRSLQFQNFPRDETPTLFVGASSRKSSRSGTTESGGDGRGRRPGPGRGSDGGDRGSVITAYSFGVAELGEEA